MVPLADYYSLLNFQFFTNHLILNIILLIVFILLITLSAFFSSAETAYSSANILRLRNFMDEKKPGAKKAVYIAEKFDFTLTTILIGNTFVNINAVVIAFYFITNIFDNLLISSLVTAVLMLTLVLFFGEIFPKQRAKQNPEEVALRKSAVMYFFVKLLYPITFLFVKARKSVMKNLETPNNPKVTEEELESIIETMENDGVINEEDADLLQSAMSLNDTTVYDIMTPRVDIIAIEENMTNEEIKQIFFDYQFSRMPVYREDKDNIIGILSEKDFFTALLKNQEVKLSELLSKPLYVSETTKVNDLIKEMQRVKKHFAIVADEYGGTSGIVTMEDALEELVGEIYDEYDEVEGEDLTKIGDNKYLVSTEMELDDLFENLELGDTPESPYTTVGGFVYGLFGGMPYEGGVVHYQTTCLNDDDEENEEAQKVTYDLVFIIKKVVNKRIKLIELDINKIEEELDEE